MSSLRWLSFILLFCIDVHVKAETLNECWGKEIPCAVKGHGAHQTLKADALTVAMSPFSLLEQRDEKSIYLVSGDFYIETSRSVAFRSAYGKVWCEDNCKAILERRTDSLTIKSLEGRWLIERKGENQQYSVPAGLQVTIGEVSDSGQAAMEFPQSLPWTPTVKEWASLYPGKISELKPTLVKFRETWHEAVEAVSQLHHQAASRTLASFANAQAEERARQLAHEREDRKLRELFRDKNP